MQRNEIECRLVHQGLYLCQRVHWFTRLFQALYIHYHYFCLVINYIFQHNREKSIYLAKHLEI